VENWAWWDIPVIPVTAGRKKKKKELLSRSAWAKSKTPSQK
jgi:hypothetical protein